jgi:hypothetical protein
MFLIYFAKEKRRIIDRLVENASKIYAELAPAKLEDDAIPFFFRKEEPILPKVIDGEIDIAENREKERRRLDLEDGSGTSLLSHSENQTYPYTDDLSDIRKLHLADRHLDALGQVIRNFSTTLLEKDKIKVLQCAYLLGLRSIARILSLIFQWIEATEVLLKAHDPNAISEPDAPSLSELKIFIKKIAGSVGVADMEGAYQRVMQVLPSTNATKLTDVTIQMDHFREFPESRIIELNQDMRSNPFAQGVLKWLVASYLLLYRVDRLSRQRVSTELELNEGTILKLSLNQSNQ